MFSHCMEPHNMEPHRGCNNKFAVELIPQEVAIDLGISSVIYQGESGKSPRIGEDGCWEVFDNETQDWIQTGVFASGGSNDYDEMVNKPKINGFELTGDKTASQLGLENCITNSEIEALFEEG